MRYLITVVFFLLAYNSFGQDNLIQKKLKITDNKSTFLIFDAPVEFHDLGSDEVGLKTTEKPNIVKIKGARGFKETNLTILTENGQYYSFLLNYSPNPDTLNFFFKSPLTAKQTAIKQELKENKEIMVSDSLVNFKDFSKKAIQNASSRSPILGRVKYKVGLVLKGIYVHEGKMFFQVSVFNQSALSYDIDFIKFNVKNKKGLKKATVQEVEMQPRFSFGTEQKSVSPADKYVNFVYVFDKFTLTNSKTLSIELWEKNGERSVFVEVSSNDLLKAENL